MEVEFDLPFVKPLLATGDDLIATCGNISYTITPSFDLGLFPDIQQTIASNDVYSSARVRVQTTDLRYALAACSYQAPYKTDYLWQITATMEVVEYAALVTFDYQAALLNMPQIKLQMYDHCYGMTIDGPPDFVKIANRNGELKFEMFGNSHYDTSSEDVDAWQEVSKPWSYSIHKFMGTGESNFKIFNLNYTRSMQPLDPSQPPYERN